ncbi:hypothetical protein CCHL11_04626 [Colletotrichum chlorophyti]|uniref:Uncharacterized protein n=1 Tax=Colletotrichum chlorophyti TaxID=708187 RepID=A0A1Q8RRQ3_9PEZI|nr:hypothetical protein CCHL11_04626 [Colletotrichum chlorophyti]
MVASKSNSAEIRALLTSDLFAKVRRVWFSHISDDDQMFVPSEEHVLQWFSRSDVFDDICRFELMWLTTRAEFGSILTILEGLGSTGHEIIAGTELISPLDWMSLVILLDQIPRNCFRDDKAGIAYKNFDQRALSVALEAIRRRIPEDPVIRYRQTERFWFYMPLEHSESMEMQTKLFMEHKRMFSDSLCLLFGMVMETEGDAQAIQSTKGVLARRKKDLENWIGTLSRVASEHRKVLKRFGRYPHRNGPLNRVSTKEETEYLGSRET